MKLMSGLGTSNAWPFPAPGDNDKQSSGSASSLMPGGLSCRRTAQFFAHFNSIGDKNTNCRAPLMAQPAPSTSGGPDFTPPPQGFMGVFGARHKLGATSLVFYTSEVPVGSGKSVWNVVDMHGDVRYM